MINRQKFLTTLGASAVIPAVSGYSRNFRDSISQPVPSLTASLSKHTTTSQDSLGIVVAGDARGNMIGIVYVEQGKTGPRGVNVEVAGSTPRGAWKRITQSGDNGVFTVGVPHGSIGAISVTAAKDGQTGAVTVDVRDLSFALTPRPVTGSGNRLSLNGSWKFAVDPPADSPLGSDSQAWHDIKVPAHWEMEGFASENGQGVYKKTFTLPPWAEKRIKLHADAIYSSCIIYVNGQRVGSHEGGATPFVIDITDAARPAAENTIIVLVNARSKSHSIDMASFFAYFELAGIWQSVEVFAVEPAHISRLAYVTSFDENYGDAVLSVDVDIANEQSKPITNADLKLTLLDPAEKQVDVDGLAAKISLGSWEIKKLTLTAKVPAPKPWNAEQPRLYELVARLSASSQASASVGTKVGFRTIEIKGKTCLLNGKPVKLKGVSRLEADPLLGRALTDEVNRLDIQLMKAANFNAFRATIFPPHPAALDYADELGLYVEDEGPATFVHSETSSDLRYAPMYAGIMSEMVERDRNHPSVIYYSICNESVYGRVFQIARDLVHKSDPSRLSSATWVTIDPGFSDRFGPEDDYGADVATLHHPIAVDRVKLMAGYPKPVLFDECLTVFHGTEDLAFQLDVDPGMHDFWVTGVPEIIREIRETPNCLGSMQFAWTDDKFLVPNQGITSTRRSQEPIRYTGSVYKMPGRGIIGEVAWGTLDGWRRPRPEFWLSKKVYSPIHIEEKPLKLSNPIMVAVENLNTYTNLDQYVCKWELAGEKGKTTVRVEPGRTGELNIQANRAPSPKDVLALEFHDERGELVDVFRLPFQDRQSPAWTTSGTPARIVIKNLSYMNELDPVCLVGRSSELSYDRSNGELKWALANGEQLLNLGPTLHLRRSVAPKELEYPAGWKFAGETHAIDGGQAVIHWTGAFGTDFTGGYQIRMDDEGNAEFHYGFTYSGPDVYAREIGLSFVIPLQFDTLTWDRCAEYSYYPADHIGRPAGEAVAHPNVPQTVPPGNRPYSLDDHPWGCNDFRSTKRNIYQASLKNQAGQRIKIVSDGTQHIRAMMGVHDISVSILDFYGGSGPPNIWSQVGFHYGAGKLIKPGDVLKGVVRFQLIGASGSKNKYD